MDQTSGPQRTFLLLGSGEFEAWSGDVERRVLETATGDGSIAILPTASATEGDDVFDRWGRMGLEHYRELGIPAEVLPVKTHDDALQAEPAQRVAGVSMIYFSGGKPNHLAKVLADTPLWAAILAALDRGAVYAGCSAGAMVASQSSAQRDAVGDRRAGWTFGLGLVPNVSFGVHWDKARKIPGLAWFMGTRIPAGSWFVGIDERTAILGDGIEWEVFGKSGAMVRRPGRTVTYPAGTRFRTPDADRE